MKLRQKLAAVLAATMMVTALPVVTMAATETTTVVTAIKDKTIDRNVGVVVDVNYDLTSKSEFYITFDGAEWIKTDSQKWEDVSFKANATGKEYETGKEPVVNVVPTGAKEAKVWIDNAAVKAGSKIDINFQNRVKLTGDEAKVTVDANETPVKGAKDLVFAKAGASDKVTITAGDATSIYDQKDEVAAVTIEETVAGQFNKASEADRKVTITLNGSDYKFGDKEDTLKLKVTGKRGFSGKTFADVVATVDKHDEQQITFTLPQGIDTNSRGAFEISGLNVETDVKSPEKGELKADVKFGDTTKEVKLADVAEYGVKLEMKDKKPVEFNAGQDKEIEFTIKETVKDTIAVGRVMEVKLNSGYFVAEKDGDIKIKGHEVKKSDFIKDDDKVVGFEYRVFEGDKDKKADVDNKEIDEFKVTGKIALDLAQEDKTIEATVSGRAIGGEAKLEVAKVKAPVKVTTEGMILSVGQSAQEGGKIVIKEADKGMIQKGDIVLTLAEDDGISFKKADLKVEAEGFKAGKPEVKKVYKETENEYRDGKKFKTTEASYELRIPVTRSSKDAGSITITGLNVTVDRTIPQGSYSLKVGGDALTKHGDIEVKDFFTIGTPNADAMNGLRKGTTSFVINSTKYVVNGVEKTLDAAPYVSAAGRTMVPVRALADAFGVDAKDIMFSNGTVIIVAGNKTVTLTSGSNMANVNGAAIKMDEKVTIKNGRAYAPASQIGNLLGVEPAWDQATQTASFTNK